MELAVALTGVKIYSAMKVLIWFRDWFSLVPIHTQSRVNMVQINTWNAAEARAFSCCTFGFRDSLFWLTGCSFRCWNALVRNNGFSSHLREGSFDLFQWNCRTRPLMFIIFLFLLQVWTLLPTACGRPSSTSRYFKCNPIASLVL